MSVYSRKPYFLSQKITRSNGWQHWWFVNHGIQIDESFGFLYRNWKKKRGSGTQLESACENSLERK